HETDGSAGPVPAVLIPQAAARPKRHQRQLTRDRRSRDPPANMQALLRPSCGLLSSRSGAAARTTALLHSGQSCAFSAPAKDEEGKPLSEMLRDLKASEHFDLIVIGSGPAGQKCAIDHAKTGKSVAVIDKRDMHGGVCVHTGTVPSKTFREAILHLTGHRHRSFYDGKSSPKKRFGIEDILQRVRKVEGAETDITRHQLIRNGVELVNGTARFLPDPNKNMVAVLSNDSYETATDGRRHTRADICKRVLTADKFLIAVGTHPARRADIPFDGETIFDSDQILWGQVKTVPKRLIVVGAGVIGMEYASMISIIPGSEVTVIDGRKEILDMADREVAEALCYSMRQTGTRFFVEESIKSVEKSETGEVIVHLNSGKTIVGDGLLYTLGRQGNTEGLNLGAVGLEADKRGLIKVDNNFQTAVPHIYAAGDCIGFPALASTSMEQGRLASVYMRTSKPTNKHKEAPEESTDPQYMRTRMRSGDLFPFGIYTVPEISMVGKNEQQLTKENIPYEVGVARYEELAKGQMLGGVPGFLKIIFCPKTLHVLGVHAIGEGATEIIHIGQVVMSTGGTLEYFRNAVFNYPTLAEAYRVAALHGLSKRQPEHDTCDLTAEQIEEIRMITAMTVTEICRVRRKYKTLVKHEEMTRDEFESLPGTVRIDKLLLVLSVCPDHSEGIQASPLKARLFQTLELTDTGCVAFAEFARFIAMFSYNTAPDGKLKGKQSFKIHDFDGDGKISREDLRTYADLVLPKILDQELGDTDEGAQQRQEVWMMPSKTSPCRCYVNWCISRQFIDQIVTRVMEESASDPAQEFLVYEDFAKVIQSTDFESHLVIPF
ncbi:TPA: hypothetical protein N0F65_000622, partial [Lagenidium giganteum]